MKRGGDARYHSRPDAKPDASLSQLAKAQDRQKPSLGHTDATARALALGLGQTVRGPDQPAFEQHEANVSVATAGRLCVDGDGGTTDDMPGSTRRLDGHKQRGNIHHQAPAQPTATGLNLTNQDLDILRSSMLSLPSTFWRSSQPSKATGSLAEPSQHSPGEVHGDDIPEDIREGSLSPQRPAGPAIMMSASTGRRVSRPLSNRLTAAAQLGGPKLPLVPASQANHTTAETATSSARRSPGKARSSGDLLGRKVQQSASARKHAAAAAIVAATADSNSSACSTPRQTDGDTILHGLAYQAQQLQCTGSVQQGTDLQSAVATLTKLRTQEGLNLDLLFETLLESRSLSEPAAATAAEPGAAMQQRPISMRLPRGLLGGAVKKPAVGASDNQIVIRLLNPHEKSSDSVALNRIQLHDANEQQIPLPASHVAVRGCPPNQHTEISVLVSGSSAQPWIARLPKAKGGREATGHVELVISLPEPPSSAFGTPCTLRVWNCSGPNTPVQKGVKWLAVFRGAKVIWHGVLRQGSSAAATCPAAISIPLTKSQSTPTPSVSPPLYSSASLARATSGTAATQPASGAATPEPVVAAPASDLATLSDAALLAELQRRGIATGPVTPAAAVPSTSTAADQTEQQTASLATSAAAPASHAPVAQITSSGEQMPFDEMMKTESTMATIPAQSSRTSRTGTNSSRESQPMPADSPRLTYKGGMDSDAVGRELVLSADANTVLPAIHLPEICVADKQCSLSPRFDLSPEVESRDDSLGSSPKNNEDLSLCDAVKQRVESVTVALVAERHSHGIREGGESELAVPDSTAAAERGSDGLCAVTSDGGVLLELPQRSSSSVGTELAAPLSLQPERMSFSKQDTSLPLPQAPQTSLSQALEGSDGALDQDILGDYVRKSRPSGRVSARRKQGLNATGALVPAGAPRPDAENALGCSRQPAVGRSGPPVDLNQSLDSLTFFQRHNRSRLVEGWLPQVHEDTPESTDADQMKAAPSKAEAAPQQVPPETSTIVENPAPREAKEAAVQDSAQRPRLAGAKDTRPDVLPSAPGAAVKASVAEWSTWSVNHEGLAFLMDMGDSSKQAAPAGVLGSVGKLASALVTPREWPDPEFHLPLEPTGRHLELRLFTTWGDLHYIGLSAVEVFDAQGKLASLTDRATKVTAEPHSVNSLPEYSNDPRVPSNLFDGVNCTSSDLHQWLAPYTPGGQHIVRVDLGEKGVTLGMLRFWNYNKSRIHAQRGVRSMEAWLDGKCIFQGEITQAPGAVQDAPQCAESVLYTANEKAIVAIEAHDALYEQPAESNEANIAPHTLPACAPAIEVVPAAGSIDTGALLPLPERPHTAAVVPAAPRAAPHGVKCSVLLIEVLDTWGDMDFVGLTSVRVLDGRGEGITLSMDDVVTDPRDLNTLMHHSGDDRTPDKLIDGVSVTMDDRHMWLAPCADHTTIVCTITLHVSSTPSLVSGITFWNYNKDSAGTLRGVGVVRVYADGKLITPETGVAIAKAPGVDSVDFGHTLPLPHKRPDLQLSGTPQEAGLIAAMQDPAGALKAIKQSGALAHHNVSVRQGCVTPVLPCGFVLKLIIWNSWADPFYVGLTGIEVHDAVSGPVAIPSSRISAMPFSSVAILPNMSNDARTPDKLVNGDVCGAAAQSWLAPRPKNTSSHDMKPNVVVLVLPTAVALSKVRFWNYHKNPERGVCEMEMFLDDHLIFSGYLKQASPQMSHQTILFSNDPAVVAAEKPHVVDCTQEVPQSHVTLIDETRVRHRGDTLVDKRLAPTDRPNTAVVC